MSAALHVAVMTQEIVDGLQPRSGGRYIDGTLGGGTHTEALLNASIPDGQTLSLDLDAQALQRAKLRFASFGARWKGVESNFRFLASVAHAEDFVPCDGIVLDLGLSSDELADPTKGLSFLVDGPLDMRLGSSPSQSLSAAEIVNMWPQADISRILREFGEERYADRIARAIVRERKLHRLIRTTDLVRVILSAVPSSYEKKRIHPATRTFQALRITVNDELGALREAIQGATSVLRPGGRLAIISFHSLEDRLVKQAFQRTEDLIAVTKRPIVPSEKEITHNPRARSAKLRIAEKTIQKIKHHTQNYVPPFSTRYEQTT